MMILPRWEAVEAGGAVVSGADGAAALVAGTADGGRIILKQTNPERLNENSNHCIQQCARC
jgi:hypothetical protein